MKTDNTSNAPMIDVDPEMVERYIMDLAAFGSDGGTGVSRTVYSPEWVDATAVYETWCTEAGLDARRDAVGNIWGRLEGSEGGPSIVSGSHIDSQTPGGRYDGALGALSGLIALRVLRAQFGAPKRTLECIAFCEEESSRFPSANFWGSRGITGNITAEDTEAVIGFDGISIGNAMREVGLDPTKIPEAKRDDIGAFIELHIEQGPILEHAGLPVAVVTGITGIRHYEITLTGTQNHAGAFPMDLRRDPMAGFAEMATGLIDTANRWGRPAVTTVGRIDVVPNATAIIPDSVTFTLDTRHPDPERCAKLHSTQERLMREVAERRGLGIEFRIMIDHAACPSDPNLVTALDRAAKGQQVPVMHMASGAGHDSQQMAKTCPIAMLFVRSKDGRSHTPEEFSSIPDIVDGIRVLAAAMYDLAYV